MSFIEIYTRPGCGYCEAARNVLTECGVAFTELNVYTDPKHRLDMKRRTTGETYPQIFIDGQAIGGYEELLKLQLQDTSGLPPCAAAS